MLFLFRNALHKTANNKYKIENYVENLMVHIQIYLNCGLLNKANNLLKKYRKKYIQNCDKNIELYNMFLEAYASRRKVTKVLELYNMIKEDSLTPTPQTYVYIFDVLGKESASNQIGNYIYFCFISIFKNKFSICKIFIY